MNTFCKCISIVAVGLLLYLALIDIRDGQRKLANANAATTIHTDWPTVDGRCTVDTKWKPDKTAQAWQDEHAENVKASRILNPLVLPQEQRK